MSATFTITAPDGSTAVTGSTALAPGNAQTCQQVVQFDASTGLVTTTSFPATYTATIYTSNGNYRDEGSAPGSLSTTYSPQLGLGGTSLDQSFTSAWPQATDDDLALTGMPADITTPATSPTGAVVIYALPTVVDEDSLAAASVSCSPDSGTTFAIGTTTVTCTATDSDDTSGPVTTSFKIMVTGAAEQLADVYAAVQGVGPGTSLADQVAATQSSVASGQTREACEGLTGFINEVSAQSGKTMPATQAGGLVADAQRIQSVLGCSK